MRKVRIHGDGETEFMDGFGTIHEHCEKYSEFDFTVTVTDLESALQLKSFIDYVVSGQMDGIIHCDISDI